MLSCCSCQPLVDSEVDWGFTNSLFTIVLHRITKPSITRSLVMSGSDSTIWAHAMASVMHSNKFMFIFLFVYLFGLYFNTTVINRKTPGGIEGADFVFPYVPVPTYGLFTSKSI
jgi:hypothetical protein